MADETLIERDDDDKPATEEAGELVTIEEDGDTKQEARTRGDDTAAAQTRSDDDDDVEIVVDDDKPKGPPKKGTPAYRRMVQKQAQARSERELAQSRVALAQLRSEVEQLRKGGTRRDLTAIDERLYEAQKRYNEAEELMATAVSKGEGEAHVRLLRIRDAAAREHGELLQAKQQLAAEAAPERQPVVTQEEKLRTVRENTQRFQARNQWYGQNAEATQVAQAIDAQVAADGYDPSTAAYWQELESRLRVAHEEGDLVVDRKPQGRRTPPSGVSRSSRAPSAGRSQQIFVSQARIDAMKEAGQWDDPKVRNRVLKRFAEYDKNSSAR